MWFFFCTRWSGQFDGFFCGQNLVAQWNKPRGLHSHPRRFNLCDQTLKSSTFGVTKKELRNYYLKGKLGLFRLFLASWFASSFVDILAIRLSKNMGYTWQALMSVMGKSLSKHWELLSPNIEHSDLNGGPNKSGSSQNDTLCCFVLL